LSTPGFTLSWSGTDAVGEIAGYSIWVSTDGGDFVPLLENTQDTSTFFQGVPGKGYGFVCAAKDTASNIEVQSLVAEATTRVAASSPADINGDGKVDCADLAIVKASFGKRRGQARFDSRADTNNDGIVDVRDLAFVAQKVPAGTKCQ
jgi:trimeric autotransporter adhesin